MTLQKLKQDLSEGNGIYFVLSGKKCGVSVEVENSIFTYTVWYGDTWFEAKDVNEALLSPFFDGKSVYQIVNSDVHVDVC